MGYLIFPFFNTTCFKKNLIYDFYFRFLDVQTSFNSVSTDSTIRSSVLPTTTVPTTTVQEPVTTTSPPSTTTTAIPDEKQHEISGKNSLLHFLNFKIYNCI
jgi:hypothetical protein